MALTLLFDRRQPDGSRRLGVTDPDCGLEAVLVLDSLTLGPAAGGIRTAPYVDLTEATEDAARLARAMTLKNALAGLPAGGGKMVVRDHPGLDRRHAFAVLGGWIQSFGGDFRTAGDLGTTAADLAQASAHCAYVHTDTGPLADAVARGLSACLAALARHRGRALSGLSVAIQGCGAIGAAVARSLAARGVRLVLSDLRHPVAMALAEETGADLVDPSEVLRVPVDVLSPCATGGVLTETLGRELQAWGVCGAANNVLADPATGAALHDAGIVLVPDILASAGAVIEGIGRTVMGLTDRGPLIDGLGATTAAVLRDSQATGRPPTEVAVAMAKRRLGGNLAGP